MAGASRMDFRVYALYSVIGGIIWAGGVTALGHWLGQVDVIRHNIEKFAILIVVVSLIPVAIELLRARRTNRKGSTAA
jgi:membrane-associated protein